MSSIFSMSRPAPRKNRPPDPPRERSAETIARPRSRPGPFGAHDMKFVPRIGAEGVRLGAGQVELGDAPRAVALGVERVGGGLRPRAPHVQGPAVTAAKKICTYQGHVSSSTTASDLCVQRQIFNSMAHMIAQAGIGWVPGQGGWPRGDSSGTFGVGDLRPRRRQSAGPMPWRWRRRDRAGRADRRGAETRATLSCRARVRAGLPEAAPPARRRADGWDGDCLLTTCTTS